MIKKVILVFDKVWPWVLEPGWMDVKAVLKIAYCNLKFKCKIFWFEYRKAINWKYLKLPLTIKFESQSHLNLFFLLKNNQVNNSDTYLLFSIYQKLSK